ncbi:UDP-forming cellulose synthase catalytic subunit [Chitiniphilus eburneus]|uniref:Cellulose synthase catalytic subunit [UDP-forming] n=1 Tax=Chitiniphilus eburneus TaxID=2571148 RepID=A0A4U0Q531_9NEIS|nr:UDP-forming cellulose synthase catalytic subunit [Chitiniphilus eburneus]TJZ76273.1 UDP-forming cellulose synthase catalytic subunit [Chitiniphilus eburneus]
MTQQPDRITHHAGLAALLALAVTVAMALLVSVPVDTLSQLTFAAIAVATILALRVLGHLPRCRLFFMMLAAFLTLRYVYWRTTSTIEYHGVADLMAALLLYCAELYGIVVALLGMFVNVRPLRRQPQPLPADPADWPTVDVFIPTYNESPDILEVTLRAACNLHYPRDKLRVYLLDDGGTEQKRGQNDTLKAITANVRLMQLTEMARRHGAHYISRERNEHAKAGNINAALRKSHGDLVAIFDADHVPTVDFLEKTVGFFVADPKMFLVQTPHFFINPDPIEKNLQMFGEMPSENEMFYSVIQHGLDFWNAAFFCGSAAVLRRACLEEVGGIQGGSITEDAETALALHARGYNSAYLGTPMISGLQPETFSGFVTQRVRWAQGMVQIFLMKNPLLLKGLTLPQRLCYFSSTFFWFFGFARVMFLVAPLAYLIGGLHIYDATFAEFVAYTVPHVVGVMLVSDFLFGKVRWAFVSELYELLQSFFSLPGIVQVLKNPRAPTFNVTPKGEQLEEDFISRLSGPFYLVYLLVLAGMGFAAWRYIAFPLERGVVLITLAWNCLNLLLLNAAIGALFERRQRRGTPRMPADLPAELVLYQHGEPLECRIDDLSATGARLVVPPGILPGPRTSDRAFLAVHNPALSRFSHLRVKIQNERELDDGSVALGVAFVEVQPVLLAEIVALAHGDSSRWQAYRQSRARQIGIGASLVRLGWLGARYAFDHSRAILDIVWGYVRDNFLHYGGLLARRLRRHGGEFITWISGAPR